MELPPVEDLTLVSIEPTVVNSEADLREALANELPYIHLSTSIVLTEVEDCGEKQLDGTIRPLRIGDYDPMRGHAAPRPRTASLRLTAAEGVSIDASGCKANCHGCCGCALEVRGGDLILENLTFCGQGVNVWDSATVMASNVAIDLLANDTTAWNVFGSSSLHVVGGRATGSVDTLIYAGSDDTRVMLRDATIRGTGRYAVHANMSTVELIGCTIQGCWEAACYEEEKETTITTTGCTMLGQPPPKLDNGSDADGGRSSGGSGRAMAKKKKSSGAAGSKAKKGSQAAKSRSVPGAGGRGRS